MNFWTWIIKKSRFFTPQLKKIETFFFIHIASFNNKFHCHFVVFFNVLFYVMILGTHFIKMCNEIWLKCKKKNNPKFEIWKKKNYNPILLYMNIYIYRYFTCTLIFLCNGNQIFATCKHTLNCLIVCVLFFQSLDTQILSIQHWILKLSTTKDIPYQVLCKIINPSRSIIYRFKISSHAAV